MGIETRHIPLIGGLIEKGIKSRERKTKIVITPEEFKKRKRPDGLDENLKWAERTRLDFYLIDRVMEVDNYYMGNINHYFHKGEREGLTQNELDHLTDLEKHLNTILQKLKMGGVDELRNSPDMERNRRIQRIFEKRPTPPKKSVRAEKKDWYSGEPLVFTREDWEAGQRPTPRSFEQHFNQLHDRYVAVNHYESLPPQELFFRFSNFIQPRIASKLNDVIPGAYGRKHELSSKAVQIGLTQKELDELNTILKKYDELVLELLAKAPPVETESSLLEKKIDETTGTTTSSTAGDLSPWGTEALATLDKQYDNTRDKRLAVPELSEMQKKFNAIYEPTVAALKRFHDSGFVLTAHANMDDILTWNLYEKKGKEGTLTEEDFEFFRIISEHWIKNIEKALQPQNEEKP